MKPIDFKKILFKGAFTAAACDGEIDDTEVATLKEMLQHSLYFEGLDYESEINSAFEDIKTNGIKAIQNFYDNLKNANISERQGFQLIEVLIKIIEADGVIDSNEVYFLHQVKKTLKSITDEKIVAKFPNHINLLLKKLNQSDYKLISNYSNLKFDNFK